jgi:hypothetical protein
MKKYRTKSYDNGGTTPKGKTPAKPAAKTATKTAKPLTEGEALGSMLKKGNYSGAAKAVGEAFAGAPRELGSALRRATRDLYQEGGKMKTPPKRYKDAQGRTYVVNVQGQKVYDGQPAKKAAPAKTTASPAAQKAAAPKKVPVYKTEGEILGDKIKKGDYSGAASMVGAAFAEAPGELYRAFKRSLR